MTLQESDLIFQFDATVWQVIKYDEHLYYKKFSGIGLKGVDFIGIYKQEKVVFIEVKNFRDKHPTREQPFKVLTETKSFINSIGDKLEDTFRAVTAIQAYLKRRWWYQVCVGCLQYLPQKWFLRQDWLFWHQVFHLAQQKNQIVFILWLEIEERISDKGKKELSDHIDKTLEDQLAEFTNEVIVASVDRPIYGDSMRVRQNNLTGKIEN